MKPRFRYTTDTLRGTHSLEDCDNRFGRQELRRLEDELRACYHELAAKQPGADFRFQTELPGLERTYSVHKTGTNLRSPTIEFYAGPAPRTAMPESCPTGWMEDFLLLVRPVLGGAATASQRVCLDYVRLELEELCTLPAERVARLLLAGYLQMAAESAAELPDRPELRGIYACALRLLREAMVEDATRHSEGETEGEGTSVFQRLLGTLMRTLGM